jgi:hypothetical protein
MVEESDDGKRHASSVCTIPMKRLSTEGVTDEMLATAERGFA